MTLDGQALAVGFAIGLVMSLLFFTGLAWGMRLALASTRPAAWLLFSFFVRSALLLAVGYLLLQYLQPLWGIAGYMLAFLCIRLIAVRWMKSAQGIHLVQTQATTKVGEP